MFHKTALLAAVGIIPLLSGCLAGPVPINIRDSNAPYTSARVEWQLGARTEGTMRGEVSDGVEFQYTRARGHGDQTLATGDVMMVGNSSVTGPQQILHRVDISYAHLAYSGTARSAKSPAELGVFIGLGRVGYFLRSDVATAVPLRLEISQFDYALTMGMGLRWRFTESTAAEGRVILLTQNMLSYFGFFGNGEQTDMIQGELALVYKPVKYLALRGGYASMALTPEKTAGSPLEFRVRGPIAGMEVFF